MTFRFILDRIVGLFHKKECFMDLVTAIAAVEAAQTTLSGADSGQAAAQQKFDAAQAAKAAADQAETDAVSAFNLSLDDLIAAATAAKVGQAGSAPAPLAMQARK